MPQGAEAERFPREVSNAVGDLLQSEVVGVSRLPGGLNAGGWHLRLHGGDSSSINHRNHVADCARCEVPREVFVKLTAVPTMGPGGGTPATAHARKTDREAVDEVLSGLGRAGRIVARMRERAYPTPAWLGVGATAGYVWHVTEFVDAQPLTQLTPALVQQLLTIVERQAGQGTGRHDHSKYAWQVATGQLPAAELVAGYSPDVAALVARVRHLNRDVAPPTESPDMVHADLNPSNVLVADGQVAALVDIENAGRGTRATDLMTLQWHLVTDDLAEARLEVAQRIIDITGREWAMALAATQILLQLEWPIRLDRTDLLPKVVERGHRLLDELTSLG